MEVKPVISVIGLTKTFSGVTVLNNVDFDIYPGEVHALLGENGAGKSTLVKIISGVHTPTHGKILIEGQTVKIPNPHVARRMGIALIHQEPLTFPDLNVTENIFAGNTREGSKGLIDWKKKKQQARILLDSLDLTINETSPVKGMPIADQQMVEITCALSTNAKVIIMDEPTAALSQGEVNSLFEIVRKLKKQGKAIIFIGHRLEEIETIADRVTVLRDGEKVGERFMRDINIDQIVQMMIGRTVKELITKEEVDIGAVRLEVKNLTLPGKFENISLTVRSGEIVGMAGLVGAGRTDVGQAIFGIQPALSGEILIDNQPVEIRDPASAISKGIALVPEDRAISGLLLPFTIERNMTFATLGRISKGGFVDRAKEDTIVEQYVKDLQIKLRNTDQEVRELSGGNQQKVVLAKWLMTSPEILILDEPTRGVDVGAKAEVYKLISKLARSGKAILMISSELQEIMQLSDRVYVMCEGKMTAEFQRHELNDEKIMTAASSIALMEVQNGRE
jgi:ABC-type sugar transport system ATPase subunit